MKWEQLKQFAAAMLDEIRTDGAPNAAFREAVVTLAVEIHGDLDQIAIALRKQTEKYTEVSVPLAALAEERAARAEVRAVEIHTLAMELTALAIAREKKAAAAEADNQRRWEELQQSNLFMKRPDDVAK